MSTRKKSRSRKSPQRRPGPEGGKRDENRKRRSADLQKAALALFLARGIESITIDDIVERAGMAKGSFYRYFTDKTDLVESLFAPPRARVADAFDAAEKEIGAAESNEALLAAYQGLAIRLAAVAVEAPEVVRLYLQESRAPRSGARKPVRLMADQIAARAIDLTHVAHARGLLRPFDARVSALAVVGAVEKLLFAALTGSDLGDVLSVPGQLITLVMDGLKPPVKQS